MGKDVQDITSLEKSFVEAKEYNDASFKVITTLQKKVSELESENKSLKSMLEKNLPIIQNDVNSIGIPNELLICESQLTLLKNKAMSSELTKEDASKFQIYFDILQKYKAKPQKNEDADGLSNEDLLKIVHINGNK